MSNKINTAEEPEIDLTSMMIAINYAISLYQRVKPEGWAIYINDLQGVHQYLEKQSKITDAQQLSIATGEYLERIRELEKLFDLVFNINAMTTKEFCDTYSFETPSWKGDVSLAASEFITLDAIKWRMVKDAAKEFWPKQPPTV